MFYFPIIEILTKIAKDLFKLYIKILFRTKYNQDKHIEHIDKGEWVGYGLIEYYHKCPSVRAKADYICGEVLNLLLPATVWFINIIIWSSKIG